MRHVAASAAAATASLLLLLAVRVTSVPTGSPLVEATVIETIDGNEVATQDSTVVEAVEAGTATVEASNQETAGALVSGQESAANISDRVAETASGSDPASSNKESAQGSSDTPQSVPSGKVTAESAEPEASSLDEPKTEPSTNTSVGDPPSGPANGESLSGLPNVEQCTNKSSSVTIIDDPVEVESTSEPTTENPREVGSPDRELSLNSTDQVQDAEATTGAMVAIEFLDTKSEPSSSSSLEEEAAQYLETRGALEAALRTNYSLISWAHSTNITDTNKEALAAFQMKFGEFQREQWKGFSPWKNRWRNLKDESLRRRMKNYSVQGLSALSMEKLSEYNDLKTKMETVYNTATVNITVGNVTRTDLSLNPDLDELLVKNRDHKVLEEVWTRWRSATGSKMREDFIRYVNLTNEIAIKNNFSDASEMWLEPYESDTIRTEFETLWQELKPLYQQLHAYVRRKLRTVYGEDKVSLRGPIPSHLLGNMWGQTWDRIIDLLTPYPNKTTVDVTDALIAQGYTPLKMFQLSDQFFQDLNLTAMPDEFWQHSLIEKPKDRKVACHASAWDFNNGKDFRIKQCTVVNMEDLITVHHEMGHVQYYLQYKHQPIEFRSGANPGFHEAVGDVLGMSVATPKHLRKIGLLEYDVEDNETDINYLLKTALFKIAFLPFGYLIDKYRWDVFSGKISSDDLNCGWWNMRYELQGLKPPVQRDESQFDPGSKYHVPASVPYIRYFVSFILQFQFHKSLCLKAGQYDPNDPQLPLHRCDIDKSTEAGNALASMLQLGSSRPWKDALEELTGSREMDATVLSEFFSPLEAWLRADNAQHGEFVGWEKDGDYCKSSKA